MEGEVAFSWGSEGETVKVSAERPTGQVLNLGVQGGLGDGNGLRTGGNGEELATAQKMIEVTEVKSGSSVLKDSEKKKQCSHLLHLFSLSVTLNFLRLRS